jgi:mRNA-degrading endonuclease RelE of RelBE toxin-antitoxin system
VAYRVSITREAKAQLSLLTVREQRIVEHGIAARLADQPTLPSNAIKALRPNEFAGYEARLGDLRVLYNVNEEANEVVVVLVGRKVGSKLEVGGEEFHGHQDHPPE